MVFLYLDVSISDVFSNFSLLSAMEMDIMLYVLFITFLAQPFFGEI